MICHSLPPSEPGLRGGRSSISSRAGGRSEGEFVCRAARPRGGGERQPQPGVPLLPERIRHSPGAHQLLHAARLRDRGRHVPHQEGQRCRNASSLFYLKKGGA